MYSCSGYAQTAAFNSQNRYRIQNSFGYADFGTSDLATMGYIDLFTGTFTYYTTTTFGPLPFYQIQTNKFGYAFDKNVISSVFTSGSSQLNFGFVSNTASPVVTPAMIIAKANGKVGIGYTTPLNISAKLDVMTNANIEGLKVYTEHTADWLANTWLTVNRNNCQALKISNTNFNGIGVYKDVFRVMGNGNTNIGDASIYPTTWAKTNIYSDNGQEGLAVSSKGGNTWTPCISAHVTDGGREALSVFLNGNLNFKVTGGGDFYARGGKITLASFPDFVFDSNYIRMDNVQKEVYVKTNKHLPYMPSATEVTTNGLDLGTSISGLTQNVEENTLDIMAIYKELNRLKMENENLKNELLKLQKTK